MSEQEAQKSGFGTAQVIGAAILGLVILYAIKKWMKPKNPQRPTVRGAGAQESATLKASPSTPTTTTTTTTATSSSTTSTSTSTSSSSSSSASSEASSSSSSGGSLKQRKVFLDSTQKPIKLTAKEQLSPDTYKLTFALDEADEILGLPVGKHFKVYGPNREGKEPGKWNGLEDKEAGKKEIFRAYTPVSSEDRKR